MSRSAQGAGIGEYLISSRSFAEYTATAAAQGTEAVAVDPVYASAPEEIDALLTRELERGAAWLQSRVGSTCGTSTRTCARRADIGA